jgi:hypothetical protein
MRSVVCDPYNAADDIYFPFILTLTLVVLHDGVFGIVALQIVFPGLWNRFHHVRVRRNDSAFAMLLSNLQWSVEEGTTQAKTGEDGCRGKRSLLPYQPGFRERSKDATPRSSVVLPLDRGDIDSHRGLLLTEIASLHQF